jgi:hypothetical protein
VHVAGSGREGLKAPWAVGHGQAVQRHQGHPGDMEVCVRARWGGEGRVYVGGAGGWWCIGVRVRGGGKEAGMRLHGGEFQVRGPAASWAVGHGQAGQRHQGHPGDMEVCGLQEGGVGGGGSVCSVWGRGVDRR